MRLLLATTIVLGLSACATPECQKLPKHIPCDVNGDGDVTIADNLVDFDGDGVMTLHDSNAFTRYCGG